MGIGGSRRENEHVSNSRVSAQMHGSGGVMAGVGSSVINLRVFVREGRCNSCSNYDVQEIGDKI